MMHRYRPSGFAVSSSLILSLALFVFATGCDRDLCERDIDCQDGLYCNGFEMCDPGSPVADEHGCARGIPCPTISDSFPSSVPKVPGILECVEKNLEFGVYTTCAKREGKPKPSPETFLDSNVCREIRRTDFDASCRYETCTQNRECDDGLFCTGEEVCDPRHERANAAGCVVIASCPAGFRCNERPQHCIAPCAVPEDADGDGSLAIACGGDDCDDSDKRVHPGNAEVCDSAHLDEDCNPETVGDRDQDNDQFVSQGCCNTGKDGNLKCGRDCNDLNASVHPAASEVCNGVDDNCDGVADDGLTALYFVDADGDGHGDPIAKPVPRCPQSSVGFSLLANDCNDDNPAIQPGSLICANPQLPGDLLLCKDDGTWTPAKCSNQRFCVAQPNGTGICL